MLLLQREELAKAGGMALLAAALDSGDADASYSAMGALSALICADDRWLLELTSGSQALLLRVLAAATSVMVGTHDRSRLEAASLLACIARVPELAAQIWGACSQALIRSMLCTHQPGFNTPGWAGQRRLQRASALAIKALIEPSEWEPEAVRQQRRLEVLQAAGGLAPLVALMGRDAAGGSLELELAAAACVRFVALVPQAAQAAVGECLREACLPLLRITSGYRNAKPAADACAACSSAQ